jgi:hypothetical protein
MSTPMLKKALLHSRYKLMNQSAYSWLRNLVLVVVLV